MASTPLWDMAALSQPPQIHGAPDFKAPKVESIFFDGMPWQGGPTHVFAYYGLPEKASEEHRVPAMVLVHGGGGTARDHWVRLWNRRGYAAISMDTCGCTPGGELYDRPRHEHGGPPGWGGFGQVDGPAEDHWFTHAVADIILAHSLIGSFPEVDPARIGLTGISWGGVLACIAACADTRFRFAVPVYGCGYLAENHTGTWVKSFERLGDEKIERWSATWDSKNFLPKVSMPMLWVNGSNDVTFPLVNFQRSYRLAGGERTVCIKVRMPHNEEGERCPEIAAFADCYLSVGTPLARITEQGEENGRAWVAFDSESPVVRAEFNYTTARCRWREREWRTFQAELDASSSRASAHIPCGTTAYYFNLVDERDLRVSSEHLDLLAD